MIGPKCEQTIGNSIDIENTANQPVWKESLGNNRRDASILSSVVLCIRMTLFLEGAQPDAL